MLSEATRRFSALPTTVKLLLILSAALLPIGAALVWVASQSIREANQALRDRTHDDAAESVRSIEGLIARNALALRVAASGALAQGVDDPCARAMRSLAVSPAVAQQLAIQDAEGRQVCSTVAFAIPPGLPVLAPGKIGIRIADGERSLVVRVGVPGGVAATEIPQRELRSTALDQGGRIASLVLRDSERQLPIINPDEPPGQDLIRNISEWRLANGQLLARVGTPVASITTADRLVLLMPFLMWLVAALLTWVLVTRLLIRPLRQLQRSIARYEPGDAELALPRKLGPATEIQELRDAFQRAVTRVEESEQEMTGALEGQRRLVREVHHRVKNNLQVVASLINIHGRSAESPHARAAYGSISRRVGALSIVHRNHFAEMEENRGISLRPLISELAAELRATAPEEARGLRIDLDLEGANTTQDVAVSVAFLVTEIVEFAMLRTPEDPVEITLRRTSELTARLTLNSKVLNPDDDGDREKVQFERIISGLAKQLRSTLERKLGRYSVDLPVFPPREL